MEWMAEHDTSWYWIRQSRLRASRPLSESGNLSDFDPRLGRKGNQATIHHRARTKASKRCHLFRMDVFDNSGEKCETSLCLDTFLLTGGRGVRHTLRGERTPEKPARRGPLPASGAILMLSQCSFVRMYCTRCEAWEKEMLFERVARRGAAEATQKVEQGCRNPAGLACARTLIFLQMRQIGKVRIFTPFRSEHIPNPLSK